MKRSPRAEGRPQHRGVTTVIEPGPTRDHTEKRLAGGFDRHRTDETGARHAAAQGADAAKGRDIAGGPGDPSGGRRPAGGRTSGGPGGGTAPSRNALGTRPATRLIGTRTRNGPDMRS